MAANAPSSATSAPVDEPPQCSVYFEPKEWSRRYASTFFTASLTSYAVHADGAVYYRLHVQCVDDAWDVERRFSDFEQLLNDVRSAQRSASSSPSSSSTLPPLPPKTWLPSTQAAFVSERQQALQAFLNALLQRKDICRHKAVRAFLQLDAPLTPAPPSPPSPSSPDDAKVDDGREQPPDEGAS